MVRKSGLWSLHSDAIASHRLACLLYCRSFLAWHSCAVGGGHRSHRPCDWPGASARCHALTWSSLDLGDSGTAAHHRRCVSVAASWVLFELAALPLIFGGVYIFFTAANLILLVGVRFPLKKPRWFVSTTMPIISMLRVVSSPKGANNEHRRTSPSAHRHLEECRVDASSITDASAADDQDWNHDPLSLALEVESLAVRLRKI